MTELLCEAWVVGGQGAKQGEMTRLVASLSHFRHIDHISPPPFFRSILDQHDCMRLYYESFCNGCDWQLLRVPAYVF